MQYRKNSFTNSCAKRYEGLVYDTKISCICEAWIFSLVLVYTLLSFWDQDEESVSNPFNCIQDVNREVDQLKVDIADCERWRDRLYDAIHQGSVVMVRTNTTVSFVSVCPCVCVCVCVCIEILITNKCTPLLHI